MSRNVVYMEVTRDEYELPVAVADSAKELAQIVGKNRGSILSQISHEKSGKVKRSIYKRVKIDGDEE